MKPRAVRRGGRFEAWFLGEDERIEKYLHETSRKATNNPKFISFNWLREQKLAEVRSLCWRWMKLISTLHWCV